MGACEGVAVSLVDIFNLFPSEVKHHGDLGFIGKLIVSLTNPPRKTILNMNRNVDY
jgi:hypothetical protein